MPPLIKAKLPTLILPVRVREPSDTVRLGEIVAGAAYEDHAQKPGQAKGIQWGQGVPGPNWLIK